MSLDACPSFSAASPSSNVVLGMMDAAAVNHFAVSPTTVIALSAEQRAMLDALREALADFESALVVCECHTEGTADELETTFVKHPGLFLSYMESLVRADCIGRSCVGLDAEAYRMKHPLHRFIASLDPEEHGLARSALTAALRASSDALGGDFKVWLLSQPASVFAQFWFELVDRCKTDVCSGCATCTSPPRVSLHASLALSGFVEFRTKLDAECPDVSQTIKAFLKRELQIIKWGADSEEQECWILGGDMRAD
jgi:hypothetical protein